EAGGRNLSIHSRAASTEVIELLTKYPSAGTPVLHWFSGRLSDIESALELGAFFSVNHRMLQSRSGREIVRRIPLDKLLTESDAPFASPDQQHGIFASILKCEQELADVFDCDHAHIQQRVS